MKILLFSISLMMFMQDVASTFDPTQLISGEITAAAFSMFLVWALL